MSFDANALHDLRLLEITIFVSLLNGYKVQVTHRRKLKINDKLQLNHALLGPHFRYNLLSVKKLASQLQCEVVVTEDSCMLRGPSLKRPFAISREAYGLYILDKELVRDAKLVRILPSACNELPTSCE